MKHTLSAIIITTLIVHPLSLMAVPHGMNEEVQKLVEGPKPSRGSKQENFRSFKGSVASVSLDSQSDKVPYALSKRAQDFQHMHSLKTDLDKSTKYLALLRQHLRTFNFHSSQEKVSLIDQKNALEIRKGDIEEELIMLQKKLRLSANSLSLNSQQRSKVIICLSGGGIRGLLEIVYLQKLLKDTRNRAKELNLPGAATLEFADLIDSVAGTSTGAIIASALSLRMDLEEVRKIYEQGSSIFQPNRRGFFGFFGPKYRNDPESALAKKCREVFSDQKGNPFKLREAHIPTFITSMVVGPQKLEVYDSTLAQKEGAQVTFCDALQASTAAPLYFSSLDVTSMNGSRREHIDGAIAGCNNPSLVGLYKTIEHAHMAHKEALTPHNVIMLSIGGGHSVRNHSSMKGKGYGAAKSIISGLMAGSADTTHQAMKNLLPPERYFPVNFLLSSKHARLDSASPRSQRHFVDVATETYDNNHKDNQRFIDMVLANHEERLAEANFKKGPK